MKYRIVIKNINTKENKAIVKELSNVQHYQLSQKLNIPDKGFCLIAIDEYCIEK